MTRKMLAAAALAFGLSFGLSAAWAAGAIAVDDEENTAASDVGYGVANDSASLGGLIGYNVGLAAGAATGALHIPSWEQIGWMWAGAGIGAAVSLPVFLFYAGDDAPPAKRGFLFMGVATTLGIAAGAVFGSGYSDDYEIGKDDGLPNENRFATVTSITPAFFHDGAGIQIDGLLF